MIGQAPQVQSQELDGGAKGNYQTVEVMKGVAGRAAGDPLVRQLACAILNTAGVKSMNYLDEARAIGEFVRKNVRYVRDPDNIEQLQDPHMMVEHIRTGQAQGDCDDMALLIASLLKSVGHRPFFRLVRYKGNSGSFQHIYVVDYEKNQGGKVQRLVIDAIIKQRAIGFEIPHASGEEVAV